MSNECVACGGRTGSNRLDTLGVDSPRKNSGSRSTVTGSLVRLARDVLDETGVQEKGRKVRSEERSVSKLAGARTRPGNDEPSSKVLKLVLENNGLGNTDTVCEERMMSVMTSLRVTQASG